jgi:hypothetical protein
LRGFLFCGTLTPTLSRESRGGGRRLLQLPLPLAGEGWGEGVFFIRKFASYTFSKTPNSLASLQKLQIQHWREAQHLLLIFNVIFSLIYQEFARK